jgi:hypothetical protein
MCIEHEVLRNVISNQFEFTLLIASETVNYTRIQNNLKFPQYM